MSSGVLTLTYIKQSPLKSPVVLIKYYDGVHTDSVLGEIQFALLLSLLQQGCSIISLKAIMNATEMTLEK